MSTASSAMVSEPRPALAPSHATLDSQENAGIGKGLTIKGEVSASESIYIDGRVEGTITLTGQANRITVGRTGVVIADLNAPHVVIMGKVEGKVEAAERLEIRKDAWLIGNVVTQQITIEDGAFLKGSIDVSKSAQRPKDERKNIA